MYLYVHKLIFQNSSDKLRNKMVYAELIKLLVNIILWNCIKDLKPLDYLKKTKSNCPWRYGMVSSHRENKRPIRLHSYLNVSATTQ